ncbi:MAG: enoyl-CoA hydratase/isomerase family protein [Caulobacter sp.]|nr:enoyl-CoA hydratase/isomerase family protein [Caulobacter sp.]
MSDNQSTVSVERDGAIAWLTLDRPDQINAINLRMRSELPAVLETLEGDDTIRVIVLRGAGDRGFCAGADIKEFSKVGPLVEERRLRRQSPWVGAFDRVSKPLVAAIHGFCLGGGLEMALACDIRLAAPDAVFGLPEVNLGVIPGYGGTQRLSRLVGMGHAQDLIMTGRRIDAGEALSLGLVTRLEASRDALTESARGLALNLAAKPPAAMACAKEAVRAGWDMDITRGLAFERDLFTFLSATEDRLEAAAAFREKRAPSFTGR